MPHSLLIAAHSMELPPGPPPEWVHLLPYGTVRGRDGRGPYTLRDAAHAAQVIAATTAYQAGADIPIDYDHQLLHTAKNGQPALASGWIHELQVRPDGLWGRTSWTATASARLQAREYRYFSPIFAHRSDGTVTRIMAGALVNNPNLELTALASSSLFNNEDPMTLDALATALGLPETSTVDQIAAHCQGLATTIAAITAAAKSLAPSVGKTVDADVTEVIAAAAQAVGARAAATPDPAAWVPIAAVTQLQTQIAAMSSAMAADKAREAIAQAKADGKLPPAMDGWAAAYAAKDLDGFVAWAAAAPTLVTPGKIGGSLTAPPATTHGLDGNELAVCSQLGLLPEVYAKSKTEEIG